MSAALFHLFGSAPEPVALCSHVVEANGWVFLTGQIPTAPGVGDAAAIPDSIEVPTRRTMDNLVIVLEELGLEFRHVVAGRVFLTRFKEDYDTINAVYRSYVSSDRLRARTCIEVTASAGGTGGDPLHRALAGGLTRSPRSRAASRRPTGSGAWVIAWAKERRKGPFGEEEHAA